MRTVGSASRMMCPARCRRTRSGRRRRSRRRGRATRATASASSAAVTRLEALPARALTAPSLRYSSRESRRTTAPGAHMAKGTVLFLVGPEYEDLEVWYPKLRLEEAGYATKLAGMGEASYRGKHG